MTNAAAFDLEDYMAANFTPQEIEDSRVIARLTAAMEMDEEFEEKFCQQNTLESAYEMCKDIIKISIEDFQRIYTQFEADMTALMFKDEATGELNDSTLELVTGGARFFKKVGGFFRKSINWVKNHADYVRAGVKIVVGVAGIIGGVTTCFLTGGAATPAGIAGVLGGAATYENGLQDLKRAIKNH